MKIPITILILLAIACSRNNEFDNHEMELVKGRCLVEYGSKELTRNQDTLRNESKSLESVIEKIRVHQTMGLTFLAFENDSVQLNLNDVLIFQDTLTTNWSTATAGAVDLELDKNIRNELVVKVNDCTCRYELPTDYLGGKLSYTNDSIWLGFDNNFEMYY